MKAARQFALILAVLLPLVMPAMACALPNARLSPAESACCTQMNGQCGSMQMPTTHGCCQKEAPDVTNWTAVIQPKSVNVPMYLAAPTALGPAMLLLLPVALPTRSQRPGNSLPQSPPSAVSILRI